MNGTQGWALEPLLELWRCDEPQFDGAVAWLFQVPNRTYVESMRLTPADELRRELCVFDAQTLASKTPERESFKSVQ
jgi:hypothetical protein